MNGFITVEFSNGDIGRMPAEEILTFVAGKLSTSELNDLRRTVRAGGDVHLKFNGRGYPAEFYECRSA
jgi:hypothetical protein